MREITIKTGDKEITLTVDRLPEDYHGIRSEYGDDATDRHADANIETAYKNVGRPVLRDGGDVAVAVNSYNPNEPKTRVGMTLEQKADVAARKQCADLVTSTGDSDYGFDNLSAGKQKKLLAFHLVKLQVRLKAKEEKASEIDAASDSE